MGVFSGYSFFDTPDAAEMGYGIERDFQADVIRVKLPPGLASPERVVVITRQALEECNGDLVRAVREALTVNQFDPYQRAAASIPPSSSPTAYLPTPWHHRELDLD